MKNELQFKTMPFEVKKDSDGLILTGYGAVFGNVDAHGDVIQRGAFAKTIREQGDRIAFAYQHDIWNPIGRIISITEDEKGLLITVKISDAEKDIQTKIREGILKEMSIGYQVINSEREVRDEVNILLLTEIKLFEISLVTLAANPLAIIESIKADGKDICSTVESEFDACILHEKDNTKVFNLMRLKALVMDTLLEKKEPITEADKTKLLELIHS